MYRTGGVRLVPKFGMGPAVEKNLYLRSAVEEIRASAVFTKKYLWPHG